jgi:zinc transporter
VEAIKGTDVDIPDAVFAWRLDGKGGVKPLEPDDVIDAQHPCWLHLNYTNPESAQWLASTPQLPNSVRNALAGESLRPRVSRVGKVRLSRYAALTAAQTNGRISWWRCVSIWMNE